MQHILFTEGNMDATHVFQRACINLEVDVLSEPRKMSDLGHFLLQCECSLIVPLKHMIKHKIVPTKIRLPDSAT